MNDEVYRRMQSLRDRDLADQSFVELRPIGDTICLPFAVDDNEEIIVRLLALGCMGFIDPTAARIASIKNDLLDPALLLPLPCRKT